MLDLLQPIYFPSASYGHFGRLDQNFTWERTDKANLLREAAGLQQRNNVTSIERTDEDQLRAQNKQ